MPKKVEINHPIVKFTFDQEDIDHELQVIKDSIYNLSNLNFETA
jgi:hypothetical protein